MKNPENLHGINRRAALKLGLGGLAALGVAPLLTACGSGDGAAASVDASSFDATENKLYDAAKKEGGSLVLYTSSNEAIITGLSEAVKKRYGVTLEYQRLNSSELSQRYSAEKQADNLQADVVVTGDPTLADDWATKGWLAKLSAADVPNLESWPQDYVTDYYAIVSINPYSMAINTTKISDPPTDYSFLTTPDAKLVTVDLANVGLVAFPAWQVLRAEYGDEFLEQVGSQTPVLADSGPSAVQQLASGAAAVYYPCSMTNVHDLKEQGAPVEAVFPSEGPVSGVESPAFISEGAPHPATAKLFYYFLLTDEGQKILNEASSSPNNVEGTPELPANYVRPDFAAATKEKDELISLLGM
ncbi:MAG: extracellular solute-binding protein [Actinomycetota bacterium]|nr:extracellular solute-binding protein [Actinomycetota bacterium]